MKIDALQAAHAERSKPAVVLQAAVEAAELVRVPLDARVHAAVCATGLPPAWEVETGRLNESLYVAPLLDAVRVRGFTPHTAAMDRGYDNNRVYDECHERGIAPVPAPQVRIQPDAPIKRGTPEWAEVYRRRTSVEREFGRLKHEYGLAFLRVRGLERVRCTLT